MTEEYQPISEWAERLYLDVWSCGPECCGAYYVAIYATVKDRCGTQLWESEWRTFWYDGSDKEEIAELRQEVIAAADHYGIKLVDIDDDCIYDWEGERNL